MTFKCACHRFATLFLSIFPLFPHFRCVYEVQLAFGRMHTRNKLCFSICNRNCIWKGHSWNGWIKNVRNERRKITHRTKCVKRWVKKSSDWIYRKTAQIHMNTKMLYFPNEKENRRQPHESNVTCVFVFASWAYWLNVGEIKGLRWL